MRACLVLVEKVPKPRISNLLPRLKWSPIKSIRELMHIKQSASDKYGKLFLMLFTNSDLVMAFPATNGLLLLLEAHSPASETLPHQARQWHFLAGDWLKIILADNYLLRLSPKYHI